MVTYNKHGKNFIVAFMETRSESTSSINILNLIDCIVSKPHFVIPYYVTIPP